MKALTFLYLAALFALAVGVPAMLLGDVICCEPRIYP